MACRELGFSAVIIRMAGLIGAHNAKLREHFYDQTSPEDTRVNPSAGNQLRGPEWGLNQNRRVRSDRNEVAADTRRLGCHHQERANHSGKGLRIRKCRTSSAGEARNDLSVRLDGQTVYRHRGNDFNGGRQTRARRQAKQIFPRSA